MFNFGWGELVVIGIVALIAIGPKELPTVLRTLGQAMGKIRRMAAEFQGQFHEAIREAELTDLKKQAEDFTTDISSYDPMADTQKEVERAFEIPDLDKPAEPPASAVTETAGALPVPSVEPATPLPEVTPLPDVDVPLPEPPAPLTEKDFAAAEPQPARPTQKQAGGSA